MVKIGEELKFNNEAMLQIKTVNDAVLDILTTLKESDCEATESPYWLILDPQQNMRCDIDQLAGQITGPFFSREDAQEFLNATRYNFSPRAIVYCHSGYYSQKYKNLCRSLRK